MLSRPSAAATPTHFTKSSSRIGASNCQPVVVMTCSGGFRQALAWAVERQFATVNASNGIKNPKRKRHERREVHPFESWQDVEVVADELDERYRAIPFVAVGCGLRPEELFALERRDVDRQENVLHIRRRFTGGALKEGGKTDGSVRAVPLRKIVLDALHAIPPRIDSPILFPAPRGGHIDIEKFRHREWTPALRAAAATPSPPGRSRAGLRSGISPG
jgi:integrase